MEVLSIPKISDVPSNLRPLHGEIELFNLPGEIKFSAFYLNEKMDDEMEADLNGLLIYLGLGYPRIEAYQAFLETFKNAPSNLNKKRYDMINNFINNFEKMDIVIK
jgi:hypothetical protein